VPADGQTVVNIPDGSVRSSGFLININAASASEIETLPGIGEVKASQIVTYRDEHGLFMSVEDLLNVPGIGSELLETIRPLITLSN
jgi:competence protein ComEA